MPRYYDIDTILAEEEFLVVRPKFSFAHLSHLDPDHVHRPSGGGGTRKRPRRENDDGAGGGDDDGLGKDKGGGGRGPRRHHHLPEGTKVQMPLWLVDKWAMLNFVSIPAPPKHYRRRMRERLEADAVHMNLCNKTDHYFLAGTILVNLLLRTVHAHRRNNPSPRGTNAASSEAESASMDKLLSDARSIQSSLLSSMMGERLCRNFDWTLSALDAMEDDVTSWVCRLSTLERAMFGRGLDASGSVRSWRECGCGRLGVSLAVLKGRTATAGGGGGGTTSGMTPTGGSSVGVGRKRRVVTPTMGDA